MQIPPERLDQIAHRFAELEARMASGTLEGEAFVRASWRLTDTLSLQPYLSWVYNRSNIALYTFHKTEGGVMLRYEIR